MANRSNTLIQKETQRVCGPANDSWPRKVLKDITLGGIPIKKGDTITLPFGADNRLKSCWGEDGHLYKPERWEDADGGVKTIAQLGVDQNIYAPFGIGKRGCIGRNFGELMVT